MGNYWVACANGLLVLRLCPVVDFLGSESRLRRFGTVRERCGHNHDRIWRVRRKAFELCLNSAEVWGRIVDSALK